MDTHVHGLAETKMGIDLFGKEYLNAHPLDHGISLHTVYPVEILVQEVQNTTYSLMGQKEF